ncbi:MAG TPA: PhoH family protein [Gammaproteobacteria bacterium]|nr:PhoH family protein [Gammaproteobacteria bacterium]
MLTLSPEDNSRLFKLVGKLNEHLHLIEKCLGVVIKHRGHTFSVSGNPEAVEQACESLNELYEQTNKEAYLAPQKVHVYLQAKRNTLTMQSQIEKPEVGTKSFDIPIRRGAVKARGEHQVEYVRNMLHHDINFGIGPAGTGKTYLAVACAVNALETERVSRIVLVRPIVEAGERLGFLPGDLAEKVHPYLRPLYDALYEMIGFEQVEHLLERDVIELVPLAYMRGRSLNDSFIILDEAQNTTAEQMKMFLTRIGFNSKAVITGDVSQIDLPNRRDSGLIQAMEVLKTVKGISFTQFQPSDVVRHPLVQSIVEAYDKHNEQKK